MSDSSPAETAAAAPPRRRWILRLLLPLLLGAVVGAGLLWIGLKREPEFLARAERQVAEPAVRRAKAAEFQQQTQTVAEAVKQKADWSASFTQPQINAWLADEFEIQREFHAPEGVAPPLVELGEGVIRIGSRVDTPQFQGVISAEIRPLLTNATTLVLELVSLRAGDIPIPDSQWVPEARRQLAGRRGLSLQETPHLQLTIDLAEIDPALKSLAITKLVVAPEGVEMTGRRPTPR